MYAYDLEAPNSWVFTLLLWMIWLLFYFPEKPRRTIVLLPNLLPLYKLIALLVPFGAAEVEGLILAYPKAKLLGLKKSFRKLLSVARTFPFPVWSGMNELFCSASSFSCKFNFFANALSEVRFSACCDEWGLYTAFDFDLPISVGSPSTKAALP